MLPILLDLIKANSPTLLAIISLVSLIIVHNQSEAKSIRKELRTRCRLLESSLEAMGEEIDRWQERYYQLTALHAKLENEHLALKIQFDDIRDKFLPPELAHIYEPPSEKSAHN